jgi:hypothetical protein
MPEKLINDLHHQCMAKKSLALNFDPHFCVQNALVFLPNQLGPNRIKCAIFGFPERLIQLYYFL